MMIKKSTWTAVIQIKLTAKWKCWDKGDLIRKKPWSVRKNSHQPISFKISKTSSILMMLKISHKVLLKVLNILLTIKKISKIPLKKFRIKNSLRIKPMNLLIEDQASKKIKSEIINSIKVLSQVHQSTFTNLQNQKVFLQNRSMRLPHQNTIKFIFPHHSHQLITKKFLLKFLNLNLTSPKETESSSSFQWTIKRKQIKVLTWILLATILQIPNQLM